MPTLVEANSCWSSNIFNVMVKMAAKSVPTFKADAIPNHTKLPRHKGLLTSVTPVRNAVSAITASVILLANDRMPC